MEESNLKNFSDEIGRFTGIDYLKSEKANVIIEMKGSLSFAMSDQVNTAKTLENSFSSLVVDHDFSPVSIKPVVNDDFNFNFSAQTENYLVKANVSRNDIARIEQQDNVIKVWDDTYIEPFACPIPPCDCNSSVPKGKIADVAAYMGANQIWALGYKGEGIVVAVVDGGITASGRPVLSIETTKRINNVIDGWPADWGTTAKNWDEHGNMCATDVLGMATEAKIFDIRISGAPGGSPTVSSLISNAIAGYQWCINNFRANGTPQIMTNSWGIYQSSWDPVYASNPAHPFTRKVEEALSAGIIILFAAGNCGDSCADRRCGSDQGSGKSIWGANGHPQVMTVGAVNKNEQYVGYSSQGPAALDPRKPDFCSITHFTGYFPSDSGTSAATPITAGLVALFKQSKPSLTQGAIKTALMSTAKDIGPTGWDIHSGAGIIQGKMAFNALP
jgi:serine protease AprX